MALEGLLPLQQEQPGPWPRDFEVFGAWAERSLVAIALRVAPSKMAKNGVVKKARGDIVPHAGQAQGSADCAIGRVSLKPPHSGQL